MARGLRFPRRGNSPNRLLSPRVLEQESLARPLYGTRLDVLIPARAGPATSERVRVHDSLRLCRRVGEGI